MIDLNHASNAIGAQERPLGGRVRAGSLRRRAAAAGGVKIVGRGRTRGSEIEEDELSGDRAHVAGRQDDCCDRKLDDRIFRNGAVADRNVGAVGRLRAGDIACGRNEDEQNQREPPCRAHVPLVRRRPLRQRSRSPAACSKDVRGGAAFHRSRTKGARSSKSRIGADHRFGSLGTFCPDGLWAGGYHRCSIIGRIIQRR